MSTASTSTYISQALQPSTYLRYALLRPRNIALQPNTASFVRSPCVPTKTSAWRLYLNKVSANAPSAQATAFTFSPSRYVFLAALFLLPLPQSRLQISFEGAGYVAKVSSLPRLLHTPDIRR